MTKPIWITCVGVLLVSLLLPACELESEELDERFLDLEDECVCAGTVPTQIQQPEQATVPTLSNPEPDDDDDDDDKGGAGAPASGDMSVAAPPIPDECLCAGIEDLDDEAP
jgi:hypothetical protein